MSGETAWWIEGEDGDHKQSEATHTSGPIKHQSVAEQRGRKVARRAGTQNWEAVGH